jgi:hypothetical protein
MYSPSYPKREPPFGSVEMMINGTQIEFWGVNMGEPPEYNPIKETEYLVLDNIVQAEKDNALRYLASTYYQPSGSLIPGTGIKGPRVLTFAPLLILKELPFNELIATLLFLCEKALDSPVEIEFAMTFNPHRFGFLQVRSMIGPLEETIVKEEELNEPDVLIASESALGNGVINNIRDIVYIKPEGFELKHSRSIIPDLERINLKLLGLERPYLLIVFGRLGTTDPWLGIPINWGQIGGARAIVEATKENIRMELSQGSHFFHNMINLGVKYFSLSFTSRYQIHWDWLEKQEVVEETQFLCHVRFSMPLLIKVDGRSGRGVIKTFSKAENGRISETN